LKLYGKRDIRSDVPCFARDGNEFLSQHLFERVFDCFAMRKPPREEAYGEKEMTHLRKRFK